MTLWAEEQNGVDTEKKGEKYIILPAFNVQTPEMADCNGHNCCGEKDGGTRRFSEPINPDYSDDGKKTPFNSPPDRPQYGIGEIATNRIENKQRRCVGRSGRARITCQRIRISQAFFATPLKLVRIMAIHKDAGANDPPTNIQPAINFCIAIADNGCPDSQEQA